MFHRMPIVLIAEIILILLFGQYLPESLQSGIYAVSLTIKSLIVFFLPLVIFGLLFRVSVSLAENATRVILIILAALSVSNYVATFLAHYVGEIAYGMDLSLVSPDDSKALLPLWTINLPKWIANDKAMFLGLLFGILGGMKAKVLAHQVSHQLEKIVRTILSSFTYLIPFFVAGFLVKLQYEDVIVTILKDYSRIVLLVVAAQVVYITFLYLLANKFNVPKTIISIKNMLPAGLAGFSSMSSAAAMPLTIMATEKNSRHVEVARSVIPATVNAHMLGDCIGIPIFAYAMLKNFGMPEPSLMLYVSFAASFVLLKFTATAIPGGGMIVMLPILESYFGFNAQMLSMIMSVYILFDPIMTCANVMGNGALAMIIDIVVSFFRRQHKHGDLANN